MFFEFISFDLIVEIKISSDITKISNLYVYYVQFFSICYEYLLIINYEKCDKSLISFSFALIQI